jgi:allophanate hydrolase subunit 1
MGAPPASTAILAQRPAQDGRPAVTYRSAGDRFLLVEYGEMELDLTLSFRVLSVERELSARALQGVFDLAPGLRSILVGYDSTALAVDRLLDHLQDVEDAVPVSEDLVIPSRVITMPIAFDDEQARAAVDRYAKSIRADAPNVSEHANLPYIVAYNGLGDFEELYDEILATEWWNAFTGFFPGLPFMYPLDPRYELFAPKYNPTRTWTAEGAVGIGGPCVAIYPVESPGGYQLFGRTLPIFDLAGRNQAFADDPILIKPGDRVRFERVSEDELLAHFDEVRDDRYRYAIEDSPFEVARHLEHAAAVADEAAQRRKAREAAAEQVPVP